MAKPLLEKIRLNPVWVYNRIAEARGKRWGDQKEWGDLSPSTQEVYEEFVELLNDSYHKWYEEQLERALELGTKVMAMTATEREDEEDDTIH